MDKVQFGKLILVSSDERREIREFAFEGATFQDFTIKDCSKPLGNHFHHEKFEVFYFLEGSGVIKVAKVDEQGMIFGAVESHEVGPGSVVFMAPMNTHLFDLKPGTRFVAFSSKPFDPNDMIPCPIID